MSDLELRQSEDVSPSPAGARPLVFVLCLVLFAGGLFTMSEAAHMGSAIVFALGILASGLAFAIPIHLLND